MNVECISEHVSTHNVSMRMTDIVGSQTCNGLCAMCCGRAATAGGDEICSPDVALMYISMACRARDSMFCVVA